MKSFFMKLKGKVTGSEESFDIPEEAQQGYLEISSDPTGENSSKITVRPFILTDFEDVKTILNSLREGYTIAMINIRPLKDKDMVELKRSVNKLKKTCDAIDGEIAGINEDWIVIVPSFATIFKERKIHQQKKLVESYEEDDSWSRG